jgi:hypothetical protein
MCGKMPYLSGHIELREIRLLIEVGCRNDVRRLNGAAVFTLVCTWLVGFVGVYPVSSGIIATFVRAENRA